MNYIELINRFWEMDETWEFTCCETRLYFYLLKTANRLGWVDSWTHSDAKVSANVGVTARLFKTSRNRLVQAGLIGFQSGGKGHGDKTKYWIVDGQGDDLGMQKRTPKCEPKRTPNRSPNRVPNRVPLYINKQKLNKTNNPLYSPEVGGDEVELNSSTEIPDQPQAQERKNCAKKKEPLNTSFVEPSLQPIVADWLAYKSERGQTYRQRGFEVLYKKLVSLSNGNPAVAREIVEQSMANNWAGIFEIKQTNGNDKHREGAGTPPQKAGVYTDAL